MKPLRKIPSIKFNIRENLPEDKKALLESMYEKVMLTLASDDEEDPFEEEIEPEELNMKGL
jgi:hypothetical protein